MDNREHLVDNDTYLGKTPTVNGKHLNVQVSLCVYRELTPNTYSCVLRDTVSNPASNPGIHLHLFTHTNDAAIDRGRSRCTQRFLYNCVQREGGGFDQGDVMVMIDHDIAWPAGAIQWIAAKAHEEQAIIGAIVSKRSQGEGCATKYTNAAMEEYGSTKPIEFGKDVLIPSEYVGAAFTAYPLNVLRDIHDAPTPVLMQDGTWQTIPMPMVIQGFKPYFMPLVAESSSQPGSFDYCSEDWALCARALALGHKVYATTMFIIQHWGMYPYTPEDGWNKPLMKVEPGKLEAPDDV